VSPTHPYRNPALACELGIRERTALMSESDWDESIELAMNNSIPAARANVISAFQWATAWPVVTVV